MVTVIELWRDNGIVYYHLVSGGVVDRREGRKVQYTLNSEIFDSFVEEGTFTKGKYAL